MLCHRRRCSCVRLANAGLYTHNERAKERERATGATLFCTRRWELRRRSDNNEAPNHWRLANKPSRPHFIQLSGPKGNNARALSILYMCALCSGFVGLLVKESISIAELSEYNKSVLSIYLFCRYIYILVICNHSYNHALLTLFACCYTGIRTAFSLSINLNAIFLLYIYTTFKRYAFQNWMSIYLLIFTTI